MNWPGGSNTAVSRRRRGLAALALAAAACLFAWQSAVPAAADSPTVLVLEVDSAIEQLTAAHIARGLHTANQDGASLVVIRLDTPGGLVSVTRSIVRQLFDSPVPVAVFVAPAGASASSAGTFIAAAANVAVMAPGTTIGAAEAVGADGSDLPETLARKLSEEGRAFVRSIAQGRGRNAAALERTVTNSSAYSAHEALQLDIIDLVAPDMPAMLEQLHGRETTTADGPAVIATRGADVRMLDDVVPESLLGFVAEPSVVFILFLIGGLALLVELLLPGLIVPGAFGLAAIALGFVGFWNMSGNWVGLLLLALAIGLFYGETTAPGFSLFGAGGIVCLILGGVFLFGDVFGSPELAASVFAVNPIVIAAVSGTALAAWILFIRLVMTEGGSASGFQTAADAQLEGERGVALSPLDPSGSVRVAGREWTATADANAAIEEGALIRVVGVYGQVLKVEKLSEPPHGG